MDVAKRLLDLGFHAPTTYFPLLISECLLIEPTETESRETLDAFVARDGADPGARRRRSPSGCAAHRTRCRCDVWTRCAPHVSSIWFIERAAC